MKRTRAAIYMLLFVLAFLLVGSHTDVHCEINQDDDCVFFCDDDDIDVDVDD